MTVGRRLGEFDPRDKASGTLSSHSALRAPHRPPFSGRLVKEHFSVAKPASLLKVVAGRASVSPIVVSVIRRPFWV